MIKGFLVYLVNISLIYENISVPSAKISSASLLTVH